MVVSVVYQTKNVHSSLLSCCDWYFKNSRIKYKMIKKEGLGKNQITYMKHIKIQSYHMGFVFIPKYMIWKGKQCVHIHSQIIRYHTVNVYCDIVPNFQTLIFLTNKHMISITKPVLQYFLTFTI